MDENPPQMSQVDAGNSGQRSLGNGRQSPSFPLKLFGQAKKTVNKIFKDISDYIDDIANFVQVMCQSGCIEGIDFHDTIQDFRDNVKGIMEVLARDNMKVVFVGSTSSGKSTVINAMLREKILPSGIGHTTNCFLQVEGGSDSQEAFLLTENRPDEPKGIQSINQLAHALSSEKLQSNSLIRIVWPKEKCRLLKEDVVLVDSPGTDVTTDLDKWIDKFCLDADVFVFVSDAVSTLTQTEKNLFHKVNKRYSEPNLFILLNKWDESVHEENVEEVKQQHLERNLEFLVDELGMTDRNEGNERIFFVSAREALASRLNQDRGTPTPNGILQEGFQIRLFEFASFERKFEECISKSAVKTKFEQHIQRGKKVTGDWKAMMDKTFMLSLEQLRSKECERREKANELESKKKQLSFIALEVKDKIKAMMEDVERKVSSALDEEITRLSSVVNEFDQLFHSDKAKLARYKEKLYEHVDKEVGGNVLNKCSEVLKSEFEAKQAEITGFASLILERLSAFLPEETKRLAINRVPKCDFGNAYRLDSRSLCHGFKEDIEFHFSLFKILLRQRFHSDTTPVSEQYQPSTFQGDIKVAILGSLVVVALVAKTFGYKVIGVCLMPVIGMYVYEQLSWTNKAKEREFKKQYVDHVGRKLTDIANQTNCNCSPQVQQQLTSTYAHFSQYVNDSVEALKEEISQLDNKISKLPDFTAKAKDFTNRADSLDKELNSFTEQFLKETVL